MASPSTSEDPARASASAEPQAARWVEAQLVRSLLGAAVQTQAVGLAAVPVLLAVLWGSAAHEALIGWALATWCVLGARWLFVRRYMAGLDGIDTVDTRTGDAPPPAVGPALRFERYRMLWPATAFLWGASIALHYDRVPLAAQFTCWLVLGGLAMFSVNSLSSHQPTMRAYLNTLAATALGIMLWRTGVELGWRAPAHHYWLMALVLLFWATLRGAAQRLHLTHRRNFELQYRNNQLIESLTRQTQAALDAVEIKNRFLASAAHDLRQPVHALGLYADWLGSEPEMVSELAPKIVKSTQAVNALFDSLFDLVRLDEGKIRLRVEPVDLAALLREVELQYRPIASARGLDFRVRVREAAVVSDPILLRRIVGNLVSNAVKYTRQGGVLLALRSSEEGLRIEVWDTGVGIAPEHQREVFREFFKSPAHSGTDEGFGLGLYIVSRLAGILGHPLALLSRPGRGSLLRLTLVPTDADAAAERAVASVAQLVSRP